MSVWFFAAALLGGAVAIPLPAAVPAWRPDSCADVAYAPFDTPNVQLTGIEHRDGGGVIVRFRIERFIADPTFPDQSGRGLVFVQLDDQPAAYLGIRTRPEEDVVVAYTGVKPGKHRVALELVSGHRGRPSVAIRCFSTP